MVHKRRNDVPADFGQRRSGADNNRGADLQYNYRRNNSRHCNSPGGRFGLGQHYNKICRRRRFLCVMCSGRRLCFCLGKSRGQRRQRCGTDCLSDLRDCFCRNDARLRCNCVCRVCKGKHREHKSRRESYTDILHCKRHKEYFWAESV